MNILTKKSIARRSFLRGLGTTLALPLLDAMVPPLMNAAELVASKSPVRMGFAYVPNGIINLKGEWKPATTGTGFEFASTMKALEPYRDRLIVFSGLTQNGGRALGDGAGDHARAGATWLTGVHPKKTEGADIHSGISADQIAAKELGKQTQIASLELGLEAAGLAGGCDSGYSCAYTNTVSWRSATTPNPVEVNPRAVFERLFGDGQSTDPAARLARMKEDSSILDFMMEDVSRMKTGLGNRDKAKLAEYLDGIRDIERRIQLAEAQNGRFKMPLLEKPSGIPDEFDEHAKLMIDLQVIAFQADLTRVGTFMIAREGSNRPYKEVGVSDGHHSVTHHQMDPDKIAKTIKINEVHVKTFAYYVEKMKNTPDGDGSLLDHSMLLYGSSISDGNQHTHHDLPLVLVGGANGQIKGGRHIAYPAETPMNNLLLTMLEKGGVKTEKFGDATGEAEHLSEV
jgi:hypothetical protein